MLGFVDAKVLVSTGIHSALVSLQSIGVFFSCLVEQPAVFKQDTDMPDVGLMA